MHFIPALLYFIAAVLFFLDAHPKFNSTLNLVSWGLFTLTLAIAATFIIAPHDSVTLTL